MKAKILFLHGFYASGQCVPAMALRIGYVANRIMSGEGKGCCMNLIVGIAGSYAGTFISHLLNIELFGKGYLTNFVFCVVGAITVLWIWKKLFD